MFFIGGNNSELGEVDPFRRNTRIPKKPVYRNIGQPIRTTIPSTQSGGGNAVVSIAPTRRISINGTARVGSTGLVGLANSATELENRFQIQNCQTSNVSLVS